MSNIAEHLAFVKEQIDFCKKQVSKLVNSHAKGSRSCNGYEKRLSRFESLYSFLEEMPLQNPKHLKDSEPRLNLTPSDLEGLPQELIDQLALSDSDKTEFLIIECVEELGGIATLDQILICLYKKTNEIHERSKLNAKVYRAIQKNLLKSVEGKKAVYELV